jgi:hypothetical protein
MIESRSQTGHRRKMTSAQLAAQSVSSLCPGAQSGINRIVAHGGFALWRWTRQDRSRKRSPFFLNQKSNWKRIQLVGYDYLPDLQLRVIHYSFPELAWM